MENTSSPSLSQFIPAVAEQIQYLPYGHICYMLPAKAEHSFPIHVFLGTDMRRVVVDQWHDHMAEIIGKCQVRAIFLLHDFRSPDVHSTPYALAKAASLRKLRPELAGASALVLSRQSLFLSVAELATRNMPSSRPANIFVVYDEAARWLHSKMPI